MNSRARRSSRSRSLHRRPHRLHGTRDSRPAWGADRDGRPSHRSGRRSGRRSGTHRRRGVRSGGRRGTFERLFDDSSRRGSGRRRSKRSMSRPSDGGSSGSDDGSSSGDDRDDTEGHYDGRSGDMINSRYRVVKESGVGTFGRVLLCEDLREPGRRVAMKVVRAIKKYSSSARLEAEILQKVNDRDKDGSSRVVRFYEMFEWRGHVCMVFEALGKSLYDYVKLNKYRPLPLRCVQTFSQQLLQSIAFLHHMKLVHTDLKPENVLLLDTKFRRVSVPTMRRDGRRVLEPEITTIKVIDFGGATFESDHHSSIVNTRQYRAPEVILQLGWGAPSDMWSVACIIMELYMGELLFATHDNHEHLALMQRMLGPIPSHMIRKARGPAREFFDRGTLVWPGRRTQPKRIDVVKKVKKLEHIIHPKDDIFLDLMRGMLRFDPAKRLTAAQALQHRFFTGLERREGRKPAGPTGKSASSHRTASRGASRDRRGGAAVGSGGEAVANGKRRSGAVRDSRAAAGAGAGAGAGASPRAHSSRETRLARNGST